MFQEENTYILLNFIYTNMYIWICRYNIMVSHQLIWVWAEFYLCNAYFLIQNPFILITKNNFSQHNTRILAEWEVTMIGNPEQTLLQICWLPFYMVAWLHYSIMLPFFKNKFGTFSQPFLAMLKLHLHALHWLSIMHLAWVIVPHLWVVRSETFLHVVIFLYLFPSVPLVGVSLWALAFWCPCLFD